MKYAIHALVVALSCFAPMAHADSPAERLSAAIQIETISHETADEFDASKFLEFHQLLERSFPKAHGVLTRERVADLSLLYTWKGSDPGLAPILYLAHIDVVPIVPESLERWEHPPFGGVIADGFVWGRGAIDDKVGVMAMLEAIEQLAAKGFSPKRTVLLAFGHDEEVGGPEGAGAIAGVLKERGVRPWMSLDEGLAIIEDGFGGVSKPVALVGIAEKGYLNLRVTAREAGGHSSMPPPSSAIGKLSRAVQKIEENPLPARIDGAAAQMLDALSPHMSFLPGLLTGNRWLFGGLVKRQLSGSRTTSALIRTTTAVTMVDGGIKANVLPSSATATINFRLIPGDDAQTVRAHIVDAIGEDYDVEVGRATPPSPVSRVDSDSFSMLSKVIAEVFPDTVTAPGLVMGGTDTKHFVSITENSYRFNPLRFESEDIRRVHGVNERVKVADYENAIRFYVRMLESGAGE